MLVWGVDEACMQRPVALTLDAQDGPPVRPFWELEAAPSAPRSPLQVPQGRLCLLWLLQVEEPALALGPAQ